MLWNLVGGGLDTTTSLTALALHHLDAHPDLRSRLAGDPGLLDQATEEFLRYFSVNETLTRTVTRDTELGGQRLCRGDHLMLSWLSANRDEAVFERAGEVVLDRAPNPHLAFGVGPHRCIGLHMARTMFKVLVGEVLARIPDYAVDRDATPSTPATRSSTASSPCRPRSPRAAGGASSAALLSRQWAASPRNSAIPSSKRQLVGGVQRLARRHRVVGGEQHPAPPPTSP